jgi:type III pantothenate kinase
MTKRSHRVELLCIDIGNSHIKAAVRSGRTWRRLSNTESARFGVDGKLSWSQRDRDAATAATGVAVASVMPSLNRSLVEAVRGMSGVRPWFITHRSRFPFRLQVETPQRIGVDRLCAAAAAARHGARSVIIIDVGSAITVDLVAAGAYRGGLIMAGPDLALRALSQFAEQLPAVAFARVDKPFTFERTDTRSAMILGACHGAVGAIKEAVRQLRSNTGGRPRAVLTGGGVAAIRQQLPKAWDYRPDLVLEGIGGLWSLNAGATLPTI